MINADPFENEMGVTEGLLFFDNENFGVAGLTEHLNLFLPYILHRTVV